MTAFNHTFINAGFSIVNKGDKLEKENSFSNNDILIIPGLEVEPTFTSFTHLYLKIQWEAVKVKPQNLMISSGIKLRIIITNSLNKQKDTIEFDHINSIESLNSPKTALLYPLEDLLLNNNIYLNNPNKEITFHVEYIFYGLVKGTVAKPTPTSQTKEWEVKKLSYKLQTTAKTEEHLPVINLTTEDGDEVSVEPYTVPVVKNILISTNNIVIDGSIISEAINDDIIGQIKISGNYSVDLPKKNYTIKLKSKSKILGMPKGNGWVLKANYIDRSHICNAAAFELSRQMGNSSSHTTPAVLYLNNQYMGLYSAMEKKENAFPIKANTNPKKSDYAFKVSYNDEDFISYLGRKIIIGYPGNKNLTNEHKKFIANKINTFEKQLAKQGNWRKHCNELSFIDSMILTDVFNCQDSYINNNNESYFIKEGKIEMSVWDFDNSFMHYDYYTNGVIIIDGWESRPLLWGAGLRFYDDENWENTRVSKYLMIDEENVKLFKTRYKNLRENILSNANVTNIVTALGLKVEKYYNKELELYPFVEITGSTWNIVLDNLLKRLEFMDAEIPKVSAWKKTGKIFTYPGDIINSRKL